MARFSNGSSQITNFNHHSYKGVFLGCSHCILLVGLESEERTPFISFYNQLLPHAGFSCVHDGQRLAGPRAGRAT